MIDYHFHKSTSKNYREVLKHARLFSGFTEGDPNVLRIESPDELFGRWEDFNLVFHHTKSWAGTTLFHNGEALINYRDRSEWFYSVQDLTHCYYRHYREACDKIEYCNDGGSWGCKRLKKVARIVIPYGFELYWFNYGKFIDKEHWQVNKQHIRMVLLEEAKMRRLDLCPGFKSSMIDPFIDSLPDVINVDNKGWRARYITDFDSNGAVQVPVGVEPIVPDPDEFVRTADPLIEISTERLSEDEEVNRMIEEYRKRKP